MSADILEYILKVHYYAVSCAENAYRFAELFATFIL